MPTHQDVYNAAEPYKFALTPSPATKRYHSSMYRFTIPEMDEDGNERRRVVYVPWTTVKEIMRNIRQMAEKPSHQGETDASE